MKFGFYALSVFVSLAVSLPVFADKPQPYAPEVFRGSYDDLQKLIQSSSKSVMILVDAGSGDIYSKTFGQEALKAAQALKNDVRLVRVDLKNSDELLQGSICGSPGCQPHASSVEMWRPSLDKYRRNTGLSRVETVSSFQNEAGKALYPAMFRASFPALDLSDDEDLKGIQSQLAKVMGDLSYLEKSKEFHECSEAALQNLKFDAEETDESDPVTYRAVKEAAGEHCGQVLDEMTEKGRFFHYRDYMAEVVKMNAAEAAEAEAKAKAAN